MKKLHFNLDNTSKVKLYRQLFSKFVDLIESGELSEGDKIPSVRVLSSDNNISRNTVTRTYKELEDAGYLYSQEKSGFYVKKPDSSAPIATGTYSYNSQTVPEEDESIPTVEAIFRERKDTDKSDTNKSVDYAETIKTNKISTFITEDPFNSEEIITDSTSLFNQSKSDPINMDTESAPIILNSGEIINSDKTGTSNKKIVSPDTSLLESYKTALLSKQTLLLKESDPFGDESLKIAIAAFLYNFHKIDVNPSQIVIGSSLEQLLYNVLRLPSIQHPHKNTEGLGLLRIAQSVTAQNQEPLIQPCIAFVETTNNQLRKVFTSAEVDIKEIPMDECGMNADFLSTSGATIAYLSPSDFPESSESFFVSDPAERRQHLLEWVQHFNYRYIFEFDTSTIPEDNRCFKGTDTTDQVVYFNSFNHLIASYVNASFVVLPKKLINEYKTKYEAVGCQVSKLEQIALSDYLISGKLLNYLSNLEAL